MSDGRVHILPVDDIGSVVIDVVPPSVSVRLSVAQLSQMHHFAVDAAVSDLCDKAASVVSSELRQLLSRAVREAVKEAASG